MVVPAEAGATAASPSEEVTKVTVAAYEAAHIAARMIKAGAKVRAGQCACCPARASWRLPPMMIDSIVPDVLRRGVD